VSLQESAGSATPSESGAVEGGQVKASLSRAAALHAVMPQADRREGALDGVVRTHVAPVLRRDVAGLPGPSRGSYTQSESNDDVGLNP